MELSSEDALRLNILLANDLQAVRIDESKMIVYGLLADGEAKVELHPTVRDTQYIRGVKELFSGHVMGSPGGYPIYLRRWTRMGQMRDDNLEKLLMLGESEAVVAVVGASGLTPELARRAWWCLPDSSNARGMLEKPAILATDIGKELVDYLFEHLAFEQEPKLLVETIAIILKSGRLDPSQVEKLWQMAKKKNAYQVGFLLAQLDELPEKVSARADFEHYQQQFATEIAQGNQLLLCYLKILSEDGQSFIKLAQQALKKPVDQEVVLLLLEAIAKFFIPANFELLTQETELETIVQAEPKFADGQQYQCLLSHYPELQSQIHAMWVLSHLGDMIVKSTFAKTDAIGTVMRRRLQAITQRIEQQFLELKQTSL